MRNLDPSHSRSSRPDHYQTRMPDFYMPAMPPLGLIAALEKYFRAWRARRSLHRLLTYDDHMLADMGYRRHELVWALRLPVTTDTTAALREYRRRQTVPDGDWGR